MKNKNIWVEGTFSVSISVSETWLKEHYELKNYYHDTLKSADEELVELVDDKVSLALAFDGFNSHNGELEEYKITKMIQEDEDGQDVALVMFNPYRVTISYEQMPNVFVVERKSKKYVLEVMAKDEDDARSKGELEFVHRKGDYLTNHIIDITVESV